VYDVIVVGGGPAGASCARRAAELGLSTLVLEGSVFPRPKPCASGLSARALARLGPEVEPILHQEIDTIRIDLGPAPGIRWHGAERVLATTTRRELDPLLARLAEAAGARLEFGRRVTAVVPGSDAVSVTVDCERLSARFVVGADGPRSVTRRSIGLPSPPHGGAIYVRAFPPETAALEPYCGSITFDLAAARRGYGWIFPKRDHLNVGVYRQSPLARDLRDRLASFLSRRGLDAWRHEGPYVFPVPTAARAEWLGRGRVVLAGDAGGLADPITGEGISHAVASGRAAAEAIAEAAERGEHPTPGYRARILHDVLPEVNVVRRAGNLCYGLGPGALGLVIRAPALRWALMRLGPWGRLGPEGGRLVVETP
jgi:geranylgeranyl reductase family protein